MDFASSVNNILLSTKDDAVLRGAVTRDGSVFTAGWYDRMALAGYVFQAAGGTITTPITFGAGNIDTTEPDFDLIVPAGLLVIPLEINVQLETIGTAAILELMASVGTGGATGTGTAATPTNLRMDAPRGASTCTVNTAVDAGATYMTANVSEFWRRGVPSAISKTASATVSSHDHPYTFTWNRQDSGVGPILYSPTLTSRLNVFCAAQAGTGFITVKWIEIPGSQIS